MNFKWISYMNLMWISWNFRIRITCITWITWITWKMKIIFHEFQMNFMLIWCEFHDVIFKMNYENFWMYHRYDIHCTWFKNEDFVLILKLTHHIMMIIWYREFDISRSRLYALIGRWILKKIFNVIENIIHNSKY